MNLKLTIKQAKDPNTVVIDGVKHHYFEKNYLVITKVNGKKLFYKHSTVLAIEEL